VQSIHSRKTKNKLNQEEEEEMKELEGEALEKIVPKKEDRFVRKLMDPKLPSSEEVESHRLMGHVEYRNWCEVCVKAAGKVLDHKSLEGKERKLPEYHFDYCFPGDELGWKWTVLVGKERTGKAWMGTAVPMKGSTGRFATDKCLEFMDENGDRENQVLIKTDQENSIEYLVKEIVEERQEGRTIVEESPKDSKGSNGAVERGVQEMENQMRKRFIALQERLRREVDAREHPFQRHHYSPYCPSVILQLLSFPLAFPPQFP
jgi:hypothetical protein